jgi:hypothetical protein
VALGAVSGIVLASLGGWPPAADPSAEAEGDKPVPDEGAPKDSP